MTEEALEEREAGLLEAEAGEESLVNVEGTKMTVSTKVVKHLEEVRKEAMKLKVPKKQLREAEKAARAAEAAAAAKRRRAGTVEHCDYLTTKNYKTINRRRTDPLITFASYLEKVVGDLRVMDEALQFLQPVNPKKVPDYLDKIQRPMDLQTIRENIQAKHYNSRQDFLADVNQIVENSTIYNGENALFTLNARKLFEVVVGKFSENEEALMRLEKAINPLLDDNDQVAFTYVLQKVLNDTVKSMQESWPFMRPVNKKQMKHYYDVIKQPMDLETMGNKVNRHAYHSRAEFLQDLNLIYNNSVQFNGPDNEYSHKARKILDVAANELESYDYLNDLELKIRSVQEREIDQDEMVSLGVSLGAASTSAATAEGAGAATPSAGKRKRGRPRKSTVGSDSRQMSDLDVSGSLMDDEDDSQSNFNFKDDLNDLSEDDEIDDDEMQDLDNTGASAAGGNNSEWLDVGGHDDVTGNHDVTIHVQPTQQEEYHDAATSGGFNAPGYLPGGEEEEEEVDANYDPTDFLHALSKPQQDTVQGHGPVPVDLGGAVTVGGTIDIQFDQSGRPMASAGAGADGSMVVDVVPAAAAAVSGNEATADHAAADADANMEAEAPEKFAVVEDDLNISDSDDSGDDDGESGSRPTAATAPATDQGQDQGQQPSSDGAQPDDDGIWF